MKECRATVTLRQVDAEIYNSLPHFVYFDAGAEQSCELEAGTHDTHASELQNTGESGVSYWVMWGNLPTESPYLITPLGACEKRRPDAYTTDPVDCFLYITHPGGCLHPPQDD
ncbi:hypothetical protein AB0O47_40095 [Streptomyces noursei]|uniref:hypothetical protein n=1 Tax=Streptomyces noursei TaxID=1971 RepID=UPI00344B4C4D